MTAATLTRPTATCHPRPMPATPAIVLADGCLATLEGKVAHGLVRGSDRFSVRAVVDHTLTRCDAGVVVNGTPAGIPVVATVADALRHAPEATVAVVGHAPHGGRLSAELRGPAHAVRVGRTGSGQRPARPPG